jgi:uncharacterized C2H2 Zn-finger protein
MFNCQICDKSYKRLSILRLHFQSIAHRDKLLSTNHVRNQPGQSQKETKLISIPSDSTVKIDELNLAELNLDKLITDKNSSSELSKKLDIVDELNSQDSKANELTTILDNLDTDNTGFQATCLGTDMVGAINTTKSNSIYKCVGCNKIFSRQPNISRHYKKCKIYIEAKNISENTGFSIQECVNIIKRRNIDKLIPKKEQLIAGIGRNQTLIGVQNNTQNITNNNITINQIKVGDWSNMSYIRPTNYESLAVLNDKANQLQLLASGYHAFKIMAEMIYSQSENKNIQIMNRRKNLLKILTVDGDIKVVKAKSAYEAIVDKLINIIDAFIDASEPLLKENPKYRTGVEALKKSHNWDGEGNTRYDEYHSYIELIIENISDEAAIKLLQFANDINEILASGGELNFNKKSLIAATQLLESIIPESETLVQSNILLGNARLN